MQPIVDRLEAAYGNRMTFLRVDALTRDGMQAFGRAGFPGHPAYLILKPDGSEVWRAVAKQEEQTLVAAIEQSLTSLQ